MQAHPTWPALDWLKKRSEENPSSAITKAAPLSKPISAASPQRPRRANSRLPVFSLTMARPARRRPSCARSGGKPTSTLRLKPKSKLISAAISRKPTINTGPIACSTRIETASAFRAAALAGPDVLALAKARAAVIEEAPSDKLLAKVPPALRKDPGFLFAEIHKLRHAEKIRAATDILLAAPRDPALLIDGDAWWIERRLLARKLLDQNDAAPRLQALRRTFRDVA